MSVLFPDCPIWNANLWNRVDQVDSEEMILKPVAMFENPFLKSPHKLVMCDVWVSHETPAGLVRLYQLIGGSVFFTCYKKRPMQDYIYILYYYVYTKVVKIA